MKRFLSLALSVLMLVSLLPPAAFAEQGVAGETAEAPLGQSEADLLPQEAAETSPQEPAEAPAQEPLTFAFTGAEAVDEDGTARYTLTLEGADATLAVSTDYQGELSYKWQALNTATGQYEDIDGELTPTALTAELKLAGALAGVEAAYRCAVTASRDGQTLTKYALFTLTAAEPAPVQEPIPEEPAEGGLEPAEGQGTEILAASAAETELRAALAQGDATVSTDIVLDASLEIPATKALNITSAATLTVPAGVMLTVSGSLNIKDGAVAVAANAVMTNNGQICLGIDNGGSYDDGSLTLDGAYVGEGDVILNSPGSALSGSGAAGVTPITAYSAARSVSTEEQLRAAMAAADHKDISVDADITLASSLEVTGHTLKVNAALTVPATVTLTNSANIDVNAGKTLNVAGTLVNNGPGTGRGGMAVSGTLSVAPGGVLVNAMGATLNAGGSGTVTSAGTMTNNGIIVLGSTAKDNDGYTVVTDGASFASTGSYGGSGRIEVYGSGNTLTGVTYATRFEYPSTEEELSSALAINGEDVTNSLLLVTLERDITINDSVSTSSGLRTHIAVNKALTIASSGTLELYEDAGVDVMSGGSLTVATGGWLCNYSGRIGVMAGGALTVEDGAIYQGSSDLRRYGIYLFGAAASISGVDMQYYCYDIEVSSEQEIRDAVAGANGANLQLDISMDGAPDLTISGALTLPLNCTLRILGSRLRVTGTLTTAGFVDVTIGGILEICAGGALECSSPVYLGSGFGTEYPSDGTLIMDGSYTRQAGSYHALVKLVRLCTPGSSITGANAAQVDRGYDYHYSYSVTTSGELKAAMAAAGTSPAWITVAAPFSLGFDLTVKEADRLILDAALTVPKGRTLTNEGAVEIQSKLSINAGGALVNRRVILVGGGMEGVRDGELALAGSYSGSGEVRLNTAGSLISGANKGKVKNVQPYMTNASAGSEEELRAAIEQAGTAPAQIYFNDGAELTADLTVPANIRIYIGPLTVPAGKTLTLNGHMQCRGELTVSGSLVNNGELVTCAAGVKAGGSISNNGMLRVQNDGIFNTLRVEAGGSIANSGTIAVHSGAQLDVLGQYSPQGGGAVQSMEGATVTGLTLAQQERVTVVETEGQLRQALAADVASTGYARVVAWVANHITLTAGLELPEGTGVTVLRQCSFTVPTGVTVKNYGRLHVEHYNDYIDGNGRLELQSGAKLLNYGILSVQDNFVNNGTYTDLSAKTYTVSYNANGGTGAPAAQQKRAGFALVLTDDVPARAGYDFRGWAKSATATVPLYQPGDEYTTDKALTLYALWALKVYTVSYDANGGGNAPQPQTKTQGKTLILSPDIPVREGFFFKGWATANDASAAEYKPGGAYKANAPATLYAVWADLAGYAVELDTSPDPMVLQGGRSLVLTASLAPENITGTTLAWELAGLEDGRFATLKVSKDTLSATITAKTVSETRQVHVRVTTRDALAESADVAIAIVPMAVQVQINKEGETAADRVNVTGSTLLLDLNGESSAQLSAAIQPSDARQDFIWTGSDDEIATVSDAGLVTAVAGGTVTVKAAAADGSGKYATVKVTVKRLPNALDMYSNWPEEMTGGKKATLKVKDDETGELMPAGSIVWSLDERARSFATIDAKSGVVKTKAVNQRTDIRVKAAVAGKESVEFTRYITLYPVTTSVQILRQGRVVTGKTLLAEVNQYMTLEALINPYSAYGVNTVWSTSDDTVVGVDAQGVIAPKKTGTATVKFTAAMAGGGAKTASVKIKVTALMNNLALDAPERELVSGGKLQFTANYATDPAPAVTAIAWSVSDSSAASISSTGMLTAKTVYEEKLIDVIATAKDGGGATSFMPILIKPVSAQMQIKRDGMDVTKKTVYIPLGQGSAIFAAESYGVGPESAGWTSSAPAVASVNETTGEVTLHKTGTAVVTAKAGSRKASVTLKVTAALVERIEITSKTVPAAVASGKSIQLTAAVGPANAGLKSVTWSVSDPSLATISATGKLTAKPTYSRAEVIVTARANDGSGVEGTLGISLCPLTTGISVLDTETAKSLGGTTLVQPINGPAGRTSIPLFAEVVPFDAHFQVTWSSSNKKVAEFADERDPGVLTLKKPGTVTIKATAKDGSGKSTSFKLTVVKLMEEITMPEETSLAGGKRLTIKPTLTVGATNKKLVWSLEGDTAYASISQKGVLTTKAVSGNKTVVVRATAADGSRVEGLLIVYIFPATTGITLLNEGANVTGKLLTLDGGNSMTLEPSTVPMESSQLFRWKSSNNAYATVSPTGVVTANSAGKKGTVTITCTATDGTGRSASVKVKVTAPLPPP